MTAFDEAWSVLKYGGKCDICGKQAPLYVHPGAGYGAEPSLCKDCQIDRDLASRTYG